MVRKPKGENLNPPSSLSAAASPPLPFLMFFLLTCPLTATAEVRLEREVDGLLRVQTDDERRNFHDLLEDTDLSLADQNAGVIVGLGQSQPEHLGLQATSPGNRRSSGRARNRASCGTRPALRCGPDGAAGHYPGTDASRPSPRASAAHGPPSESWPTWRVRPRASCADRTGRWSSTRHRDAAFRTDGGASRRSWRRPTECGGLPWLCRKWTTEMSTKCVALSKLNKKRDEIYLFIYFTILSIFFNILETQWTPRFLSTKMKQS